ncbi:GNAT family N-acetyltransferase [Lacinutrix undariae]
MNTYKVIKYTSAHYSDWNAFIETSKNATFLFHRDFMEYHKDRFEDYSLLVYKDDKIVALLPANRTEDTVYSHQGLTYGSFVLHKDQKLLDAFEAFKSMLGFLYVEGVKTVQIKLIPAFYNLLPADELSYFLFKAEAKLIKRDVIMLIDYNEQIPFQKKRREGINKAKRNNLTVVVDDNYEGFWNEILIPNLKHKHDASPVHSLEEIKLLASRFPENIKHVSVYNDGKIVAGTTLFLTKTTIHPQYVSGNLDKNNLGSLDLAYHFIINEFCDDKRYFDFNISSEDNGQKLNKGLIFWKESCGARTFAADSYEVKTEAFKNLTLNII